MYSGLSFLHFSMLYISFKLLCWQNLFIMKESQFSSMEKYILSHCKYKKNTLGT